LIGYLTGTVYKPNQCDDFDFQECCDSHSHLFNETGIVITRHWHPDLLAKSCEILALDRVCIHPDHAGKGHMVSIMKWALDHLAPKKAITLIKPFPLQFEGIDNPPVKQFKQAQTRLIDYYSKYLDAKPLPGKSKKDHWLYTSTIHLHAE
jgi:hypothetical protein